MQIVEGVATIGVHAQRRVAIVGVNLSTWEDERTGGEIDLMVALDHENFEAGAIITN
jgi:hypothetical protein